jgi:hypothetical protein
LIENHPRDPLLATEYVRIDIHHQPIEYNMGKKRFLEQLAGHPDDLDLLANSANYFQLLDPALAVESLKKANAVEPANSFWPERLGHQYSLMRMSTQSAAPQREFALNGFTAFERAYEIGSDFTKKRLLPYLAKSAFAAGDLEKAGDYARASLTHEDESGDYHYYGHMVLGRIALAHDDVSGAKDHLLESARTEGSPVLGSFGPNMSLAKDLIERGETDTVLTFFELCGKFWSSDKLADWSAAVKDKRMPNFAGNLYY